MWSGEAYRRGEVEGLSGVTGGSSLLTAIDQVPAGGDREDVITLRESRRIKAPGSEGGWRGGRLNFVSVDREFE